MNSLPLSYFKRADVRCMHCGYLHLWGENARAMTKINGHNSCLRCYVQSDCQWKAVMNSVLDLDDLKQWFVVESKYCWSREKCLLKRIPYHDAKDVKYYIFARRYKLCGFCVNYSHYRSLFTYEMEDAMFWGKKILRSNLNDVESVTKFEHVNDSLVGLPKKELEDRIYKILRDDVENWASRKKIRYPVSQENNIN